MYYNKQIKILYEKYFHRQAQDFMTLWRRHLTQMGGLKWGEPPQEMVHSGTNRNDWAKYGA